MAAPTSLQNIVAQSLDTIYGTDGTAYIKAAGHSLGSPSGITPPAAPQLVELYGEPTTFKSFSGLVITSETTIWTPTGGKKFRLMGFVITQGVLTGDIVLRDNTAGSTILTIPATPVGQPLAVALGRTGILSSTIDYVLTADGVSTETISGFVYGTEE